LRAVAAPTPENVSRNRANGKEIPAFQFHGCGLR